MNLKQSISKYRSNTSYFEDKLQELIAQYDELLSDLKKKAQSEIEQVINDAIFRDLEPAKKLAQKTAQDEIAMFKTETNDRVRNILTNVEQSKKDIMSRVDLMVSKAHTDMMGEMMKLLDATKKELSNSFGTTQNELSDLQIRLEQYVSTLRGPKGEQGDPGMPGANADPAVILAAVLEQIPKQKEFTPEQIARGLETLTGQNRLDKSAIKGLDDLVANLTRMVKEKTTSSQPQGGGGGDVVRYYDLSALLDGVTKVFTIPENRRILSIVSSSTPFTFRQTIDFTTSGTRNKILTFDAAIDAASMLATGQTISIVYSK